mmetsp:Transcript_7151/g.9968  ORF Transcript_7151/g.9968 Transcript_7151/m.9968 type:complete len:248 (+) Transcript_7151:721-1464(+)
MVSLHPVPLEETSPIKVTVGVPQLSASSVTHDVAPTPVGTSAKQTTLNVNGFEAVGAVVSFNMMICVTSMLFPASSATLYVRTTVSLHPVPLEATSPTYVTTGIEQLSASSSTNVSSIATSPIHSANTVSTFEAVGGTKSLIITFCVAVVMLPEPSSKVHVITVVPCVVTVVGSVVVPVIDPAQASIAVGAATVTAHSPIESARTGDIGATVSLTVTVNEQFAVFPEASVATRSTVDNPTKKVCKPS